MVLARHLIGEGAARHGERLAVVSERSRTSYADLDVRCGRLANALAAHGVRAGDRVVVFMGNCLEAVIAIAAVLRAGGVLVPVGAETDAADLAFVFEDCQAVAVITEARLGPVSAEAMRVAACVRLVVLAGGDQGSVSQTCLAFEDAIGRGSPVQPSPCEEIPHPLMLIYPRTPGGLAAPVTMTEADLSSRRPGGYPALGAVVEDIRPMAGARGVSALLAALAAGATVVLPPGNQIAERRPTRASAA